jgi:preprotein translocase subunit SecA
LLRPGATLGPYPEREGDREGALALAWHAARGVAARMRRVRAERLERFAAAVRAAQTSLSGADLVAATRATRERLLREGFSDGALVDAFALVREAAARALGTPHFDVQLMAGRVLADGMLAEMETGEGKTLAATLPACAAALAGVPVHVVTANDYLVQRDAEAMRPLYETLGLRVGAVVERERDPERRRAAYRCDVTYATSKAVAFDYLRDGLARRQRRGALATHLAALARGDAGEDRLLLRGLCFAIVDEADGVLIDEAGMPLILAGGGSAREQERSYLDAIALARALVPERDFAYDARSGAVALSDAGRARAAELASSLGGFWTGPRRREEWVTRALVALHGYRRDRDYLVRDGRVEIVDAPTGRVAPDRAWEGGLHQLVEAKEGCAISPAPETRARISYQRFFRRYLRLAGTTGTAREVAAELWSVYGLATVRIPTRLPSRRRSLGARVYASEAQKWDAVVARARALRDAGRPVLIGTASVAASEALAERLAAAGLPHRVLNARQDAQEAEIVAEAGAERRITVATNMAGRGTDIRLGPGVAERGGLHVIATARGPARRIDRQLAGRCARQGEPGSFEWILSLEDEPVRRHVPEPVRGLAAIGLARSRRGGPRLAILLTLLAQRAEETRSARVRRGLASLDEARDALLAFSGRPE